LIYLFIEKIHTNGVLNWITNLHALTCRRIYLRVFNASPWRCMYCKQGWFPYVSKKYEIHAYAWVQANWIEEAKGMEGWLYA